MSAAYTPGPWQLAEQERWPFSIGIYSGDEEVAHFTRAAHSTGQQTLADVYAAKGFRAHERESAVAAVATQMATVRLIATAPEMAELLREVITDPELSIESFTLKVRDVLDRAGVEL